jgi:tripartite ATP-independent transporter DctM subunit
MFPALFLFIFIGLPVSFSLIAVASLAGVFVFGDVLPRQLFGKLLEVSSSYALAAIPLFVFMGAILERSNIAERLFETMRLWMGRMPGGLALATMTMAGIFAATTGIVGAVEIVIGLMAIPAMMNYAYDKGLISGTICAGGSLGTMIPPSVTIIIYGSVAQISIGQLFAGVLIPGMLMIGFFMAYIAVRCLLRPQDGPPMSEEEAKVPLSVKLKATLTSFVPAVALITVVLGSILAGIASPTEAAAMGAVGSLILALCYGRLNFKMLYASLEQTIKINAMILFIVLGGQMFTSIFYVHGGGQMVSDLINLFDLRPAGIIILMLTIVFALGFVLEWISIILIVLPIFDPIIRAAGIDPLWFAVMMIVIMQTSYLTPPMAPAIFYLRSIAPREITYQDMFRGVIPFVAMQFLVLFIVAAFPGTATYLASMVGR